MSVYKIKNLLRVLAFIVLSTLLMLSFQNCQGLDSRQLASLNEDPSSSGEAGQGNSEDTDTNNDNPNDPGQEPPVAEEPPPPPPALMLCHDEDAQDVDWTSGYDYFNLPPSDGLIEVSGTQNNGRIYYKSSVDADSGSRMISSSIVFSAEPGQKGISKDGSDNSRLDDDSLAGADCNIRRISGTGEMAANNCNVRENGYEVNVAIQPANDGECVEGIFELTVDATDTCMANPRASATYEIHVDNVCPDMGPISEVTNNSAPESAANSKLGENMKKVGNTLVVTAEKDSEAAYLAGAAYVYTIQNDKSLKFEQKLLPGTEDVSTHGVAMDMNATWLALGAPGKAWVRVYKKNGNTFSKQTYSGNDYLSLPANVTNPGIGHSIAIVGDYLFTGSDKRSGRIYGFNLNTGALVVEAYTNGNNYFGYRMAGFERNGVKYLAVTDRKGDGNVSFLSFDPNAAAASRMALLNTASGDESQDRFGDRLSISSNLIAISENIDVEAPGVKIYELNDVVNTNADLGTPKYHSIGGRGYGSAVSFSNNETRVYIASSSEESSAGKVFVKAIGVDSLSDRYDINPIKRYRVANQQFGASMAYHGNRLFVGVPNHGGQGNREQGRVMYVDLADGRGE